jgi:hypothetical protein
MAGVPPKRGEAYTFYFSVTDQANTDEFRANPPIAAGDFQYSNDAGATFNNPATIPVVTAGNNRVVRAVLSGAEMTPAVGDKILFWGHDQVGAIWQDYGEELTVAVTPMDELIAAIWAYATRTLTGFGTLVADVVTAILASTLIADVVAAILASSLVGSIVTALMAIAPIARVLRAVDLELYRGDTWTQPIPRLGDISGRDKLWITCKDDKDDPDTQAVFMIEETAGLVVPPGAPANGSVVVTDAAVGNVTVTLEAVETAKIEATKQFWYDVQMLDGAVVTTLRRGYLMVTSDVTRAVT